MRDRKTLIYLNIEDLTTKEINELGNMELNCCDICGEIDSTYRLHWIDGEDFWDDKRAVEMVGRGNCAVCDDCLDNYDLCKGCKGSTMCKLEEFQDCQYNPAN